MPLSVVVSGANTHEKRLVVPTLKSMTAKRPEPTRRKEEQFCADKGDVIFELHPGAQAVGRVVDVSGRAVPGVFVSAFASQIGRLGRQEIDSQSTVADQEGRFKLTSLRRDLPHTLVLQAKGHARYLLDFGSDGAVDGLIDFGVLVLPEARAIEGTAIDVDEAPLAGVTVQLSGHNDDRAKLRPGRPALSRHGSYGDAESRRTDDLGRFRFSDLSPGEYALVLKAFGTPEVRKSVVLPGDQDLTDVELQVRGNRSVTVVARDTVGTPLPGIRVTGRVESTKSHVRTKTDRNGKAVLSRLPESNVRIGLERGREFLPVDRKAVFPIGQEIVFVLERAALIEGAVLAEGISYSRLRIGAVSAEGDKVLRRVPCAADGKFVMNLRAGVAVDLKLFDRQEEVDGVGPIGIRGEYRGVVAPASGIMIHAYTVAQENTLTVLVVDPKGSPLSSVPVLVRTRATVRPGKRLSTNADGRVVFENLPSETVHICAVKPRYLSRERMLLPPSPVSVVPEGQEVVLRFREGVLLAGVVEDPEGRPVSGARVALVSDENYRVVCYTDLEGRYTVPIPPGETYSLAAEHRPVKGPALKGKVELVKDTSRDVTIVAFPEPE